MKEMLYFKITLLLNAVRKKQEEQCTYNVTMWRVGVTIVAVEKQ
jgi:hypothetical protein